MAGTPKRNDVGVSVAQIAPARASPHCLRLRANMPPTIATALRTRTAHNSQLIGLAPHGIIWFPTPHMQGILPKPHRPATLPRTPPIRPSAPPTMLHMPPVIGFQVFFSIYLHLLSPVYNYSPVGAREYCSGNPGDAALISVHEPGFRQSSYTATFARTRYGDTIRIGELAVT